jgi:hypothetical protein
MSLLPCHLASLAFYKATFYLLAEYSTESAMENGGESATNVSSLGTCEEVIEYTEGSLTNRTLFAPLIVGDYNLPNRIIMAPMTRGRALEGAVPSDLMVAYYAQRADAGLIITEATSVSPQGYGWMNTPGIWNDAQENGWKAVTAAVHAKNGRIFLQLWHTGRVSHPEFLNGELPVGPSEIAARGNAHVPSGKKPNRYGPSDESWL